MDGSGATVDIGVARIDARGTCVYANERIARILGVTRDQILGDAWRRLPEVTSRIPERWDELRAGRSVLSVDSYERADGVRVSVQIESLPEADARGRVTSVLLTCVDVTDREQLTAESEQHRHRAAARLEELESVYANSPVGLALVDRELRYVRVNQVIADLNGLTPDEVVGRSYRDLSPENADLAEPFLRGVLESGASVRNLEVRARPPADPEHEHIFLLSLDPMRGPGDDVIGLVSAVQDITALRRAEETAARRTEELNLVYDSAQVGLCHMDTSLCILHLNREFARLSDRPLAEQVGRSAAEVLPLSIGRHLVPQLVHVARTGQASLGYQFRARLPGPDGRDITWIASTHPSRRGGQVIGIITVLQDVTMLAEQHQEIAEVRDRLAEAQRVARVGSWEWDLLEDRVWWSAELYEIFHAPRTHKPSYVGFFERVHPDDRPHVREQIESTLRDGKPYRLHYRVIRSDGAERMLFTVARLERTPGGQPARLVGICQDITEYDPPGTPG